MSNNYKPIVSTPRALFMIESLDLAEATGIADAVWEDFQLELLNNENMFYLERKCRQVGYSFAIGAVGVADALLDGRSSVYNSINQYEAQDKIRYARQVYYSLKTCYTLPKIVTDNKKELEFDNGARLISTASARGIPNSNFFIDEGAWKQNARELYTAGLPIISKGGNFYIGSSTNGASGLFWEIDTESFQSYPDFTRSATHWWEVSAFCSNVSLAKKEAPHLETKDRVEKFAKKRLKMIFANMVLEDFQQEYEAKYVDETTAWITWVEIQANTIPDLKCAIAEDTETIENALIAISKLAGQIQRQEIENVLYLGYDVGRTRNASELTLVGKSNVESYPLRAMITLNKCDYDSQMAVLRKAFDTLPIAKGKIDQNGLGNQLAETLVKEYPSKAEGVKFTNPSKELMATNTKMLFQQHKVPIPSHKDLAYQVHSVKKIVTPSGNNVFDTEKNEKHHADKFWALALSLEGANFPTWSMSDTAKSKLKTIT